MASSKLGVSACRGSLGVTLAIDFGRTLQRFRNAAANVFRADMAFELRLFHQFRRLFSCAAKQERAPRLMQSVGEVTNGAEAGP